MPLESIAAAGVDVRTVVGVDPGGRSTGMVIRRGSDTLVNARVLVRDGDDKLPTPDYLTAVFLAVDEYLEEAGDDALLAVEGLVHPEPHMELMNVLGLIGTGMVLAVVIAMWPECVIVRPNKHGALPPQAYPEPLRPRARRLGGESKHARSAWDIAGAGRFQARVKASIR